MELVARTCLASPFLVSAIDKTLRPQAARAEIRGLAIPGGFRPPITAIHLSVLALQCAGGLLLLHPLSAPLGALVLILFLLPATLIAHPFWNVPAQARPAKRDHFFANIAIAGGLVLVASGAL